MASRTKKDLLLLLLDVGEHMQPYLSLLHRLVYNVLTYKLINKPNHEVAVVLYGTKGTRHKLYDPEDPAYTNVSVLRLLQNVSSYHQLKPFLFAADPPGDDDDIGGTGGQSGANSSGEAAGGSGSGHVPALGVEDCSGDTTKTAAREAALLSHVEAAGLAGAGTEAAAVVGRAYRLFGPPAPDARADWADGLVVAMDLLATALAERFDSGQAEAKSLGGVQLLLVSNLLAQSEPFDDEFRAGLVETMNNRRVAFEVACLDHYVTPPAAATAAAGDPSGGLDVRQAAAGVADEHASAPLERLPADLAASRRRNLGELHRLKSEVGPGMFRHLRQPAELLCLSKSIEVAPVAVNITFRLTPDAEPGDNAEAARAPLALQVKLYKKIRKATLPELTRTMDTPGAGHVGYQPHGGGGGHGGVGHGHGGGPGEGDGDGGGGGAEGPPGIVREVEYEDPTTGDKFSALDYVARGYAYGKQLVPVTQYYQEAEGFSTEDVKAFRQKDMSLLGFIDAAGVPVHRLADESYVVLGEVASAAVAIAALAQVLQERNQAGVVRVVTRDKSLPKLGLLTPHLSESADVPHALLLSPLPFAEDVRSYGFSTFRNEAEARALPRQLAKARGEEPPPEEAAGAEGPGGLLEGAASRPTVRYEKLQPDEEQQDAALALVRALDLGPLSLADRAAEPVAEALQPEATANPSRQRVYALATSRALDPTAQLCDPDDDPLVQMVLQPHGRFWPAGAREALRRAEDKLRTRERHRGEGERDAKRARRESGQGEGKAAGAAEEDREGAATGGAAAGADAGGAGGSARAAARQPGMVFDASASGATKGRVTKVKELTAVEDFSAMLAQGADSAAEGVRQLQELVREMVRKSIGDQLYDKALKSITALRAGCVATGRAGGFNAFLRDLSDWCKLHERSPFMALVVSHDVGLITAGEIAVAKHSREDAGSQGGRQGGLEFEDDGGGVDARTARAFLEQHARYEAEAADATLHTVVADEEFEDMD